MSNNNKLNRRDFLKILGSTAATTAGVALTSCKPKNNTDIESTVSGEVPTDMMTYRTNAHNDKVSILGYGLMRLPTIDRTDEIDQEMVNRQIDYAIEHGMNFFDTAPTYCKGKSETATGIALSRYSRDKYFISTKLSNFSPTKWSREESLNMYHTSLKNLQVEYLDYLLLHSVGSPAKDINGNLLTGLETFEARYINNGVLDYLLSERKKGRIRNLGFSYHGDPVVFDYLMSQHDTIKWDFVLIQLNYVDWRHATEINKRNTNAEYLYGELEKRNIPVLVMEPLLGGRLANMSEYAVRLMKQAEPEMSVASWAFRFAGSHPRILAVLSGMTYMEHLQENIRTFSPLKPLNDEEFEMLEKIANNYVKYKLIPCTSCQYCMPCPYGLDIPTIFRHYNKCINEGIVNEDVNDSEFRKARRAFLIGYDRKVEKLRQADHCIGCKECQHHCPQSIEIPNEMHKIDNYVKILKNSMF